jgi:PST family polysaccharide transporter
LAISRDVLKVASLILGYQFLQKTYSGIVTELLSLSIIYLSSIFLVSIYGLEGCNGACLDVFRILISACGLGKEFKLLDQVVMYRSAIFT